MDFAAFLAWREQVQAGQPEAGIACETRIARAFAVIRPVLEPPAQLPRVHRCDLGRQWCALRGLPAERAPLALACAGVRHALSLLFARLARQGRRVALPADVYPVYWQLAAAAGVETFGFDTFPQFEPGAILAASAEAGCAVAVLPAPLKLHGRQWSADEARQAADWLAADPERRLVLDGVYSFGQPLAPAIHALVAGGQVIYLDSLSKGWLHERTFGIALVPPGDFDDYAAEFRSFVLTPLQLWQARELMGAYAQLPQRLLQDMAQRRSVLRERLAAAGLRMLPAEQGYFLPVAAGAAQLLQAQRLLGLPATVFGSRSPEWSIASVLPAA
jgi:DNA-binding transcriptional MocR family regulator